MDISGCVCGGVGWWGWGMVSYNVYAINFVISVVPETFEAVAGQRQVNFTWSPALITRNNTVITNFRFSYVPASIALWNSLDDAIVSAESLPLFKYHLRTFLL